MPSSTNKKSTVASMSQQDETKGVVKPQGEDHPKLAEQKQSIKSFEELVFERPSADEMFQQLKSKLLKNIELLDEASEKAVYRQVYEDMKHSGDEYKLERYHIELEKLKIKCSQLEERVRVLELENSALEEADKELSSWS